jgi:hypothetical protein
MVRAVAVEGIADDGVEDGGEVRSCRSDRCSSFIKISSIRFGWIAVLINAHLVSLRVPDEMPTYRY